MTAKKLGILALAGVLLVSLAAAGALALPPHAAEQARAHAKAPDETPGPADASAEPGAQGQPSQAPGEHRGEGLLNALEHVPERVRAHLQSIWDAFAQGLKGIGDALVKPAEPERPEV